MTDASPAGKKQVSELSEYEIIGELGKGAYGKVHLVRRAGHLYAMKQIEKKILARDQKEYQAFVERELLRKMDHPGIVRLHKCFQDSKSLYFVMEHCLGGDFTSFMKLYGNQMTDRIKRHYIAEMVTIIEYLHGHGITHRDLKPENILLSAQGHLKLIDFGTAEISRCRLLDEGFKERIAKLKKQQPQPVPEPEEEEMSPRKRRSTFVGTCQYTRPDAQLPIPRTP